MNISEQGVGEA